MKTNKEKLEELIAQSWLSMSEKETILNEFDFNVSEVRYLYVTSKSGDLIGTTDEQELEEFIDLNDYSDSELNDIYVKLADELDLEEVDSNESD